MTDDLVPGDKVKFDDEPAGSTMTGTVDFSTEKELRYLAEEYASEGVGPKVGDVIVQWDEDDSRSWEHPSYLVKVEETK